MSEAGSLASEARDLLTEAALGSEAGTELLRTPLRCAAAGLICMTVPILVLLMAPLFLIFSPLLVPLGFGLTVFGLGRAGLIVALRGPVTRAMRGSRAQHTNSLSRPPDSLHASGADSTVDTLELKEGSLRELNTLATKRAGRAVTQVTALVRTNVVRATRDISGEVEVHLHALQRELQSWAGANPNLKPYCHGHIGWLLRQEARESEGKHGSTASLTSTDITTSSIESVPSPKRSECAGIADENARWQRSEACDMADHARVAGTEERRRSRSVYGRTLDGRDTCAMDDRVTWRARCGQNSNLAGAFSSPIQWTFADSHAHPCPALSFLSSSSPPTTLSRSPPPRAPLWPSIMPSPPSPASSLYPPHFLCPGSGQSWI